MEHFCIAGRKLITDTALTYLSTFFVNWKFPATAFNKIKGKSTAVFEAAVL